MTLWFFNIDDFPDNQMAKLLHYLPIDIATKISRYKAIDDKKCRLIARLLVQYYCSLKLRENWRWQSWDFTKNQKPYINQGPYFNISHSGKIVVVGFSEHAKIGVDIEMLKPINVKEIAQYFHPEEIAYLNQNNFDTYLFYEVWTKKEAFLKASSVGLTDGLHHINTLNSTIETEEKWQIQSVHIQDQYQCAICLNSDIPPITIQSINYQSLNTFIYEKIFI